MVPATGLEPIERPFSMFSLLLIFAFLCANLYVLIQDFPSYCKHYFASLGNNRQENLCGIVRLCGKCAAIGGGLNLCGICAGGLSHARPAKTPRLSQMSAKASHCRQAARSCGHRSFDFRSLRNVKHRADHKARLVAVVCRGIGCAFIGLALTNRNPNRRAVLPFADAPARP